MESGNGNTKILVVEDNALNMKLVKSLLTLRKFEVFEAGDGEKGLSMMREHQPDMVLIGHSTAGDERA